MRIRVVVLFSFIALIASTATITSTPTSREFVESVSTFICPAKSGDQSGVIALGKKGVKSGTIDKKDRALKKSKARTLPISQKARAVAGESAMPITFTSKNGTWVALTQCASAAGEFWFIGGTADVSSLGYFQFTNENLGKAIIDLELWSEDGSESTRTLTIPARSTKNYSLTTFMPGKKLTAFHIISRSGLVSATLFDERRKGLTTYGGDYIAPNSSPTKNLMLAGIPGPKLVKGSEITSQKIRLFVPGEADAIIQVNYISPSGVFAPVGLDNLRIPAQKVVEVPLTNLPNDRLFSIEVRASEPVIGSILTRGIFSKVRELSWTSAGQPTRGEKIAMPERAGYLAILTDAPEVRFTTSKAGEKRSNVRLRVDAMAIWKVPAGVREIQFSTGTKPIYLALAIKGPSGVTSAPFAPAEAKELTALPVVDSSLYIPASG